MVKIFSCSAISFSLCVQAEGESVGQQLTEAELEQQAESALEALAKHASMLGEGVAGEEGQAEVDAATLENVLAQQAVLEAANQAAAADAEETGNQEEEPQDTGEGGDGKPDLAALQAEDGHEEAEGETGMDMSEDQGHLEPKDEPVDEALASLAQSLVDAAAAGGAADSTGNISICDNIFSCCFFYLI